MVLCVVDLEDFDGSLPRQALQELLKPLEQDSPYQEQGYRLVIAANKVDLFPPQATQSRLRVSTAMGIVDFVTQICNVSFMEF